MASAIQIPHFLFSRVVRLLSVIGSEMLLEVLCTLKRLYETGIFVIPPGRALMPPTSTGQELASLEESAPGIGRS